MLTSEVRPAEARFELTLAFHCAPALAGIKPADLIALPGEGDETDALLASYSAALAGAGISLRPLCRCRSRCLVLVAGSGGFPHEVGLFLGYPAEDVEGFRRHGGQGYKYSGLWKVYSDVERAQRCFRQYGCCRRALCRRLEAGCRLVQLFRTA